MHSDPTTIFRGRYSDGKTAQSMPSDVRLGERGVEIGFPGAPQALVWPYGALGIATPLSVRSTDALITYEYMPGASLFVSDPAFAQALMKLAPQITARAYGWRSARPWVMAAAAVGVIFAGIWALEMSPARWIAGFIPTSTRVSMGEKVIASMAGKYRVCDDAQGRAALDRMTQRLMTGVGKGQTFNVRVVDWNLMNAFAAPGEQIVLTRRIIQQAKSPEEIAGVLAHEMGHGLERHPETAIIRVIGLTAALELVTGGAGTIANVGLGLTALSYNRVAERQADAQALSLLEKAQIAPSGLVEFFRRMSEAEAKSKTASAGTRSEWSSIFQTHPNSAERARNAADRPTWPSTPALSSADWQALRSICGPEKPSSPKAEPAKVEPAK